MAVTKTIDVDGRQVTFRASAAIPRLYRNKFHRDIYRDLSELQKGIDESDAENSSLDTFSLELFENIAWLMAKHADKTVPDTPEEWLDEFGTFSIYEILPQIIELWGLNTEQQVTVKKKRHATEREMTTPLFLLRCVQIGLSISELDLLTIGTVNDMYAEMSNDDWDYPEIATQEMMDRF
nr:MAG TPA: tail assembly chaperone protein [Caudoviricetes sp.]